jgi:hypothetical protein
MQEYYSTRRKGANILLARRRLGWSLVPGWELHGTALAVFLCTEYWIESTSEWN